MRCVPTILRRRCRSYRQKKGLVTDAEKKKLRVCAYCRVSTEEDNQASSYELQVQNYMKMIQENPDWEFAGIFAEI